jgi:YjbE family integral membrane protein
LIDLTGITALFKIALIDLILSGDNAVVIALAVRGLPQDLRRRALVAGTLGAILFRGLGLFGVIAAFEFNYVRLLGGVVLVGIAIQFLVEQPEGQPSGDQRPRGLLAAVGTIMLADALMSMDNLVGIVAAAEGQFAYVIIGFLGSIPLLMTSSHFFLRWLDRYRILVWGSGALLGWIAGELMLSDRVLALTSPANWIAWAFPAASSLLVLAAAYLMVLRRRLR